MRSFLFGNPHSDTVRTATPMIDLVVNFKYECPIRDLCGLEHS